MNIGFYLWDSAPRLRNPAWLNTLPANTNRIALSLNPAQIKLLGKSSAPRRRMCDFINSAASMNIAIELLLGEPTWVLPAGRAALVDIVHKLRQIPFAALNLDLERSQLPEADQADWEGNAIDTLVAVKAHSPWPLSLTTHHRELALSDFVQQLHAAGVSEAVAMIYASRAERVLEVARNLLDVASAHLGLRIAIAQSMEPELDVGESSFSLGCAAALSHWGGIAQELDGVPGFGGIYVQSLETFESAAP